MHRMPHRPERAVGTPPSASATNSLYSSHLNVPNGLRGEATAQIMRPTASVYHPGLVAPLIGAKPWMAPHLRGMVPNLEKPKSADSADTGRSTGTKHDEECTVATLATEGSADELEKREATASALLLVSTGGIKHEPTSVDHTDRAGVTSSDVPETSTVPLKKRKKHLDFLRRNQEIEADTGKADLCHVSPVSHSSSGSHVEGRTVSREEVTPDRPGRMMAPSAQRTNSYDSSKGSPYPQPSEELTQPLLNSSKIHNPTDITLPNVVVPHFPTLLHKVLADPEYIGTVLTWLPDGEAWKVLRWDAMRRQVLPRYFSTLRDENGGGAGTIDAFLWHLTAWGFEEVTDGTDVGAYKHELFIRGAQKLCTKMRFTAIPAEESKGPTTVSPVRPRKEQTDRSMLQVPSLGLISRSDGESDLSKVELPSKRPRIDKTPVISNASVVRNSSPESMKWAPYRNEEPYSEAPAWGHYYPDASHMGMRQMTGQYVHSGYDPRMHLRQPCSESMMSQSSKYSPPQVRSGRGAMRVAALSQSASCGATSPVTRPSFPVSNRGKGRKPAACRNPLTTAEVGENLKAAERHLSQDRNTVSLAEAQRIGNAVQGVAIAVSRKTKRKLPLARKNDKDSGEGEDSS